MPLDKQELLALEKKVHGLRKLTVDTTYWAGSGHVGGGLSAIDCMTLLYHKILNIDLNNPEWDDRDRFVLSKGHVGICYAPLLSDLGWVDKDELKTFNLSGSKLGIHLDCNKVRGVDASTGSLGHGMSLAAGMALAARVRGKDYFTYCLTGDGELNEGSNWEAAMTIAQFKLTKLITIVDNNKCMMDGRTNDVMKIEPIDKKFEAFGFEVIVVDGHDFRAMTKAFETAKANTSDKPYCIILDTFKACGIDYMQDDYLWHYGALDEDRYNRAQASLDRYYEQRKANAEKEA